MICMDKSIQKLKILFLCLLKIIIESYNFNYYT